MPDDTSTSSGPPQLSNTSAQPPSTTSSASASATSSGSSSAGSTSSDAAEASSSSSLPGLSQETGSTTARSTTTAATSLQGAPQLPTGTSNSLLPTLPGGFNYPAPTVPPKIGAPYLHPSSLPQDFIFIIVGAILAFAAALILSYRLFVAWTANRSVKRAANRGPDYHHLDHKIDPLRATSSHDLGSYPMSVRTSIGPSGLGMPSSSLFFSPTAAAASGVRNNQRSSTYLSSGYYGAGGAPGP